MYEYFGHEDNQDSPRAFPAAHHLQTIYTVPPSSHDNKGKINIADAKGGPW